MLFDDLRLAVRIFRRSPGYALPAALALTIGIGANTALFTVVNAVLLRPLPYPHAGELVALEENVEKFHASGAPLSTVEYGALRSVAKSFRAMGAYETIQGEVSDGTVAESLPGVKMTASVFDVLQVRPEIGNVFTAEQDFEGSDAVVISHALWRRKFGGDRSIPGRKMIIDRKPRTIVGVMPEGFLFPLHGPVDNSVPAEFFAPMAFAALERQGRGPILQKSGIGRLNSGVTIKSAQAELAAVTPSVVEEVRRVYSPRPAYEMTFTVEPLRDAVVGNVSRILWLLWAAVGVLLLIACANVAGLTLTRASGRRRDRAIRAAMGASRLDLVRAVLSETFVIAIAGGAAGVGVAVAAVEFLAAYAPADMPRLGEIQINWTGIAFTFAIAVLTAVLSGVAAAIAPVPVEAFRDGGRGTSAGRGRIRVQGFLAAAQFSLTVILMVAGGLALRSLLKTIAADPGFRPDQAAAISTHLPASFYTKASQVRNAYLQVASAAETSPGILAAGVGSEFPMGDWEKGTILPEGGDPNQGPIASQVWITGRYLEALGVSLKAGRLFDPVEYRDARGVVIINESLAHALWPGKEAVGRRLRNSRTDWLTVIGVVGDLKEVALNHKVVGQIFEPHSQVPDRLVEAATIPFFRAMNVVSRSQSGASTQIRQLTEAVHSVDKSLAISDGTSLGAVVEASSRGQKFNTFVAVAFAAIAFLLAVLGVASVLGYSVSQRVQEIGIRMALGATPRSIARMVLARGMLLAGAGVAVGLLLAAGTVRLLRAYLYGVSPWDWATFVVIPVVLLGMAAVAAWIPARIAARVDPVVSLRADA